jgi:L-erythro-3,5-diaminohexanoate dehydrogenase
VENERGQLGHPLGMHRVKDEKPRLPQAADRLDNTLPIYDNEILINVEKLNIDAASFVQMEQETGKDPAHIAAIVQENCKTRGKQQNRVTGSGGMLLGSVAYVGSKYRGPIKLKEGDRIATLVSLSLTPLHLYDVGHVDLKTHQIDVTGHAVLFERTIAAVLPKDLPEKIAMAVFDVAGAPATVNGLCTAGKTLVVIGAGGKAGVLSCVAGRKKVGKRGKVIAIEPFPNAAADLRALGVCDEILEVDATDPIAVQSGVAAATRGKMGDVVINVASVPDTEVSALLSVKSKGKIVFFSMATSFTRVALGAEGIVSDATLIFGNGYYPDHSKFSIELVRKHKKLRDLFHRRYQ